MYDWFLDWPLGLALGGLWGFREGSSRKLAVSNARLRINSILNSVTRRGSFMGNSAGVLGAQTPSNEPEPVSDVLCHEGQC